MFGFRKLRRDLPPIDIRKKPVKGLIFTSWVKASRDEQRKMKKKLESKYPDRYFVDDLNDWNSIRPGELDWWQDLEMIEAFWDD